MGNPVKGLVFVSIIACTINFTVIINTDPNIMIVNSIIFIDYPPFVVINCTLQIDFVQGYSVDKFFLFARIYFVVWGSC